ncbi:cysteine-rich venom protein 6-like [Anopheles funestus]|uniref:cysteine-rich venom protein 6-like n=1 Tax=Anopheles funestus TaxID=62324 RepID=UPI0020C70E72|nr:cysteine-rich venom protein 6-like [Anopheles funestus]
MTTSASTAATAANTTSIRVTSATVTKYQSSSTRMPTTTAPRCIPTTCGKNEVFLCCGLCSFNTCRGWVPCLDTRCVQGCFCMVGFVRAHPKGPCIPHQNCPKVPFPLIIRQ